MLCQKHKRHPAVRDWELSLRAAQGSLDPHQIREEQQPWSSGKAQQPQEQQLGGCPHPPQTGMSAERGSFLQPPPWWREASPEELSTSSQAKEG